MVSYSKYFKEDQIQKMADFAVEVLSTGQDWDGCTRMDIAIFFDIPVSVLEKAMGLNEDLDHFVLMVEQRSLQTDINKLKYQMTDKKTNSTVVKLYFGAKHGLTDRNMDEVIRRTVNPKENSGGLRVIVQGPDGEIVSV